tara:strand:- start:278 stop:805 length:528 start_codon:yes stop_codon:yes gene_type:complete
MDTIIIENFFENFNNIKDEFKKIPLYSLKDYNKRFLSKVVRQENWPGKRSQILHMGNPFLFNLIVRELNTKTTLFKDVGLDINSFVHLRLKEDTDKDWIHIDPDYYTLMVYLSETNLNSGTAIYPEQGDIPSTTVGFVQNRAVLFRSNQRHISINSYGDNLENGRLTLNCFLNLR